MRGTSEAHESIIDPNEQESVEEQAGVTITSMNQNQSHSSLKGTQLYNSTLSLHVQFSCDVIIANRHFNASSNS